MTKSEFMFLEVEKMNYTPTQLKDALRILKAFRDNQNYSKTVRRSMAIAIEIIKKTLKED